MKDREWTALNEARKKKVAGGLAYYNRPASAVFSSHGSPEGHLTSVKIPVQDH